MSDVTLTNKEVKTRKHRNCDWCGEPISAGDVVRYRTGIVDGDFYTVYEHVECYKAVQKTDNHFFYDEGYTPYEQLRGIAMQDDPR